MKNIGLLCFALLAAVPAGAGPFAPAAGQPGSTAIPDNSPAIVGWATGVASLVRGPIDITEPDGARATFGTSASTRGVANARNPDGSTSTDPFTVVSLGDGGSITLTFAAAIVNGPGPDFAVFENAFNDTFLELAFVEVSANGIDFLRFPCASLTPVDAQIDQGVDGRQQIDPTNVDGLAGKYRVGFGTPFDLARVNLSQAIQVRIVDVVGSIDPAFARYDTALAYGLPGPGFEANHIINDPWPTDFPSGGFDLDAVAVLYQLPEPASSALLLCGAFPLSRRRRK